MHLKQENMNQDFDEHRIREPLWMVPLEREFITMKQTRKKLSENLDGLWD